MRIFARVAVCVALAVALLVLVHPFAPIKAQVPSGGTIQEIRIEGTQRVEPETVRSYLLVQPGDAFDTDRIDRSLKALFATGLFSDVTLRREGDALIVRVVENPVINRISFEGNDRLSDKTLTDEIQMRPRLVYTREKVQSDVKRILDLYRRNSRFAATVDPKVIPLEQNRVDLVFEINEGPATGIAGINFVGNNAFAASRLREVDSDERNAVVPVPEFRRHLRSRPADLRPRSAAQVLFVRGICRFPPGLGRGRTRAGARRVSHHLHGRRGRALSLRQDQPDQRAAGGQSRHPQASSEIQGRRLVQRRSDRAVHVRADRRARQSRLRFRRHTGAGEPQRRGLERSM